MRGEICCETQGDHTEQDRREVSSYNVEKEVTLVEHRFSEQEQGQIFARAIELQREAGHALTLSEMEATALEAGIDPQYVRMAAEELELGVAKRPVDLLASWRSAALCATVVSQIYTVSGQVLEGQRDFYIPFAMAAAVGALFAGRKLVRSFTTYLSVSIATACLTAIFLVLEAGAGDLTVPRAQAAIVLLVESLLFVAGYVTASAFQKNKGGRSKSRWRTDQGQPLPKPSGQ